MKAPNFTLADQNGQPHSLGQYAGKWLVLYFYPKDETLECTAEACNFRDARQDIANLPHVEVVGISKDSVESHKAFAEKHQLNFTILSDPDHKTIEAYGAWGLLGTKRQTFIIDPDGKIVKRYQDVNPEIHAQEIIRDLKILQG